ncbi:tektin-2-like [Acropora palmata]|uniref:tektin-2-like n=1 Tax=Acropora palmata TaxID=6131 RepID=UPI003DA03F32
MALTDPKIPPRFAVSDWHTSNTVIRTNAERQRDASHRVRQESRFLRNETDNHTRWTQHDSNTKLEKRIYDINSWKRSLERCLAESDAELALLQQERERTERALEAKKVPLDVTLECLMLRDNRQKIDLVRDEVEAQLHKEVEVIEGAKALLQQKVSEAFEQLCILQEARHQLHLDITDKYTTLEVDGECYGLNNNSENIGFQVHPTRTVKGSVTPETWDSFSNYNKLRAEAEMKASKHLREAIFATLQQTANDLEAQRQATEYAFRKRVHETNQAKSELEWQQKNTMEEISTLENDIKGIKEAIDAKNAPMKVAQTRLENRTYRPNVELCRDQPQYQMCHEVAEIGGSIRTLNEKLREAENALQALRSNLERINEDLATKNNSLALDNRSLQVRQKMKEVPHSMMNTGRVFNSIQNSSRVPTMENAPFTEAQDITSPVQLASPRATQTLTPPVPERRGATPLVD